jgi:hypothetical protein
MPRGWSEGGELGLARAGMFMAFPLGHFLGQFIVVQDPPVRRAAGTIGTLAHLTSQPLFAVPGRVGLLAWPFRYSEMK